MKLFKLAALLCACALFAAACASQTGSNQTANTNTQPTPAASTPAATPADQLADARKLYGQVCSRCHGDTGEGGEFDIYGKKEKAPSLRSGHAVGHDDARLARKIAEGGDGMPAFKKRLSPEQVDNLVRFIRHDLQAGASAGTTNANHATPGAK
jgi:mono/diheme cytochrome c family protein